MEAIDPSVAASENALRQAQRAQSDLAGLASVPGKDYAEVAAPLAEIARLLEAVNQQVTLLRDSISNVREEKTHD